RRRRVGLGPQVLPDRAETRERRRAAREPAARGVARKEAREALDDEIEPRERAPAEVGPQPAHLEPLAVPFQLAGEPLDPVLAGAQAHALEVRREREVLRHAARATGQELLPVAERRRSADRQAVEVAGLQAREELRSLVPLDLREPREELAQLVERRVLQREAELAEPP